MPALEFDKPATSPYQTQCFIIRQSKKKGRNEVENIITGFLEYAD